MTIDGSSSNLVTYPKQDVAIYKGHVGRLKDQFCLVEYRQNPSLIQQHFTGNIDSCANCTGLKPGTVKAIANLWGGFKQPELKEAKKPFPEPVSSDNLPRKRVRRKKKKTKKLPPKAEEITVPRVTVNLTLEQWQEMSVATERIKTFIHIYNKQFFPPKIKGVFRVSPSSKSLSTFEKQLKKSSGNKIVESLKIPLNEHLLAGIMKKTLRELSTPAIPTAFYNCILSVCEKPQELQLSLLQKLIPMIPYPHQELIASLMLFLGELASYEEVTSMDANNLAIVIAPNILRAPEPPIATPNLS